MFIYFNPNPVRRVAGDCVVRAICKAMRMTWDDAYWAICMHGYIEGDMPSSNSIWRTFLLNNGFKQKILPNTCPDCYTVKDFCNDHPYGVYILFLNQHVVCVEDGDYFDTWNSGDEVPTFYFEREW